MLHAIKNLGILKLIEEFPEEFDFNALDSTDSFLEQREKAISKGEYAKLQFETLKDDNIGIFSINNSKVSFEVERVSDDSWKYLFLKTAPNGSYITPTWKEDLSKKEDNEGKNLKENKKLKYTVQSTIEQAKDDKSYWLQNLVSIYEAKDIEVGEFDDKGELKKLSFFDTVKWAKKNKKLKVFSTKIDGKYNSDIKEILDLALEGKKDIYQTKKSKSFKDPHVNCSLCNKNQELFPNVLSGVGINIGNVDKPGFFPGVDSKNASKSFPICAPCAEILYVAKFYVFPKLIRSVSGHRVLFIPHLVESKDKVEGLKVIKSSFERINLIGAKQTERDILKDLSENKGVSTVTFLVGEVDGQTVKNIRKVIPGVLPSRLSEISESIEAINTIHNDLLDVHPWKLSKLNLDSKLEIINDIFGPPKYLDDKTAGRKKFKAYSIDTLQLLNSIFLSRKFSLKNIITEFSAKLSYDFLGSLAQSSNKKPTQVIQENVSRMAHFLLFLERLDVIEMSLGTNFVSKYLEKHDGLKPLNDFLINEAKGINTKEKQFAFLVGLLFGKLISFQMAKGVSANALKWLKGLQLNSQDLVEIFIKTKSKLDDYSTPKSAWSDEMRGLAEAIAALGADISDWNISRKEIPYYLCLGQSLSHYYLPSKNSENKPDIQENGE